MNEIDQIARQVTWRVDLSPLEGRTVLITGASGLVGTHLARAISLSGAKLHLQANQSKMNAPEGATVHYANLANPNDCARLPEADIIISGANWAQPLRFLEQPLMALRSASYGLMALLEKVRPGGRFLYISSSEVYCGCTATPPFREEDEGQISPYHPRACYIVGKIWGEAITHLYRNRGISTVAVRPGITYGPGFRKGDRRSWAQFIERAMTQNEIRLMDAGKVKRTFCFMTDGIEHLLNVLLYGAQPVYNMSGRDRVSIYELAELIGKCASVPVIVPEVDHGVGGTPDDLQMDSSRVELEFGKSEYTSMTEGMAQTVEWAKRQYARN